MPPSPLYATLDSALPAAKRAQDQEGTQSHPGHNHTKLKQLGRLKIEGVINSLGPELRMRNHCVMPKLPRGLAVRYR